jgi:thiamine biosynthesis lipoprotein
LPVRTEVAMGTLVTIRVLPSGTEVEPALDRAFAWFREIEDRTTRFNPASELRQLTAQTGIAVPVSAVLYEAVHFALMVAEASGGAFDPTVGRRMEARGFNREYRTGKIADSGALNDDVSYRDVELDPGQRSIMLHRPLTLDLGAVAKGLAVDMAARELEPLRDFAIDAGGDLYLGGRNERGAPWCIGIRHPRKESGLIASVYASDQAVCTSGDYERKTAAEPAGEQHILDPRTGASPRGVVSATVVASGAMLADALATAALVLGPDHGIELLDRQGVDGLLVTPELKHVQTRGLLLAA